MLIKTRSINEQLGKLLIERELRAERKRQANPRGGLMAFVRYFWPVLEPVDPFVEGWPLECMCAHLEAVTNGDKVIVGGQERPLNRLLMNVPPGFMKSLLVNVFWPAWEWGPRELSHLRYVCFSYAADLTERDNDRFLRLIKSEAFQEMWGHVFRLTADGKVRVQNDKTGFKFASSFGGVGTGERGHRVLFDDPHKLKGTQESDDARQAVVTWFIEGMQNRVNDLSRDVIITIMQRVHENDVSGAIRKQLFDEYCALLIPMEYTPGRHFSHYKGWNGGQDPRTDKNQLAWPKRYPMKAIASFKRNAYLWAGQYQQDPVPRGGGLFKEDWIQPFNVATGASFEWPGGRPLFVLASLDTAFKEGEQNDYSALTIWGAYDDAKTGNRRILLMDAWQKKLPLNGTRTPRMEGEDNNSYMRRSARNWGLVEWVNFTCTQRAVDVLIVEDSARGHDVTNELQRLYRSKRWQVQLIPVRGDKWVRAQAALPVFTDEMVYAPGQWKCAAHGQHDCKVINCMEVASWFWRDWVKEVIEQLTAFPRGQNDDIVDTVTMALTYLRRRGIAVLRSERMEEEMRKSEYQEPLEPLYPA